MKYDFFSFCHFGVDQTFCYVVCEHLHNMGEGASYLSLFCYRPVSLSHRVKNFLSSTAESLVPLYRFLEAISLTFAVAHSFLQNPVLPTMAPLG